MPSIITITFSPCIDKSASVNALVPEKKLKCSPPKLEPGGGGINVARALKKLGKEAVAVFPSGGYTGKFFNHLLEKENIPRIVQIRDTSGLEPLTPLEIFGGFNLSKFSDERKDFLMAEYRLFIDRLRTLKTNLETDTPSLPYFTTDQIVLDKDGHIKILSVDFYKKTEDSVHQTQEQIDKIITFIETIMFPLLRAGKQNRI